jgi:hypothetical protein
VVGAASHLPGLVLPEELTLGEVGAEAFVLEPAAELGQPLEQEEGEEGVASYPWEEVGVVEVAFQYQW